MFPGGSFEGDTYRVKKAEAGRFWSQCFGNRCVPASTSAPFPGLLLATAMLPQVHRAVGGIQGEAAERARLRGWDGVHGSQVHYRSDL